ncbi:hypothetical protein R3P38DRAFT_3334077 [Favolaschia claudopus]|uniref:DUF6830 domain-containing protein n=1 Tax=Favolaschia claudopus TaxID=2862362 RepID=A0AAV9ZH13_9AGAR
MSSSVPAERPYQRPVKRPLTLFYRDPLECLQALMSNPLIQDFVHFTPFKLWTNAGKLVRVYNEWLSSDGAWDIQKQLPKDATLLGTVISTDKTQLTTMTGNKQAYPALISLANIDEEFRMKASNHAFMLFCLVPIFKFLEKNPEVAGVLVNREYHAVMEWTLQPLIEAAKVGVLMEDPLGCVHWGFTPLVSQIVDTPESLLVACAAANHSSVTQANYKQFGDPFLHPPRTASYTLTHLRDLAKEYDPWNDLEAYIKAAKALGLNGVHLPFWREWAFSDPARFLTPEILHHWLKMFYDHHVGAAEIDFRFSILRPHTGMRHFKEGISRGKQTTGREHRDIQRYIVGVIAGAVPKEFLKVVASLNDFFYQGQAPQLTDTDLQKMTQSLADFHAHKDAILKAGARRGKKGPIDHWRIPKLEFLQSVVPSVRISGVPMQWTADVTERAHITLVKDPAYNSNNQGHEAQICRHLDRLEKCRRFDLSTSMANAGVDFGQHLDDRHLDQCIQEDEPALSVNSTSELLNIIEPVSRLSGTSRSQVNYFKQSSLLASGAYPQAPQPYRTFTSTDNSTAFHLSRDHTGRQITLDDLVTKFNLPDLPDALAAYLHRARNGSLLPIGGHRPILHRTDLHSIKKLEYWRSVRLQSKTFHRDKVDVPATINAWPPDGQWKKGRADAVICGMDGHVVCQLRLIFRVVLQSGYAQPIGTEGFLAYVQKFAIVPQENPNGGGKGKFPDPTSGQYVLKRAKRAGGVALGDVVPLDRLRAAAELQPKFGREANRKLTKETSLDYWDDFWLSRWFTKEFYYSITS